MTVPIARAVRFFNYPEVFTSRESEFVEILREVGSATHGLHFAVQLCAPFSSARGRSQSERKN